MQGGRAGWKKLWVRVRAFMQMHLDAKGWPCTTSTGGPVEPIFFLAKASTMRDKDNGKANVPDVDKSYEEVVTWRHNKNQG